MTIPPPGKNKTTNGRLRVDGNEFRQSGLHEVDFLEERRRREERIISVIHKGKQTSLAKYTKGINQSQFDHNGKDGPLVVFAEELRYRFANYGNYKAVRKYYRPNDNIIDIPAIDNITSRKSTALKAKLPKGGKRKSCLMLDGKLESGGGDLTYTLKSENFDLHNHEPFHKELKLPKLKSDSTSQENNTLNLEYSKNTELPKLPAQEYIDNFRRDAAEYERSLQCVGRGTTTGRRQTKVGKTRDSILPKIDEKMTIFASNSNKFLTRDDHFRLPKLHHKNEPADGVETVSKKTKRKARNSEQKKATHQDSSHLHSRHAMSHSERKATLKKEQSKWCKMTFQSNAYI